MSFDRQEGQSTVELALCLPFVVVILAVVVQVALVGLDQVRLWHGAREAARVAAVDPDVADIRAAADRAGVRPFEIDVVPEDLYRRQGEPVTVTVSHSPSSRIPFVGRLFDDIQMTAVASMRIEEP